MNYDIVVDRLIRNIYEGDQIYDPRSIAFLDQSSFNTIIYHIALLLSDSRCRCPKYLMVSSRVLNGVKFTPQAMVKGLNNKKFLETLNLTWKYYIQYIY